MIRPLYLATLAASLVTCWADLAAQSTRATARDSAETERIENAFAVATSGVWKMDGEYKGTTGKYFKATGYFAYVASTTTSDDDGDRAVIAFYLEPMAGGDADWLSARLQCEMYFDVRRVQCVAVQGAAQLLDLNFLIQGLPTRGESVEVSITEPSDKEDPKKRWTGRSSSRGKLTLVP